MNKIDCKNKIHWDIHYTAWLYTHKHFDKFLYNSMINTILDNNQIIHTILSGCNAQTKDAS